MSSQKLQHTSDTFANSNSLRQIRQIWHAAVLCCADPSGGALLELRGASRDAGGLSGEIKGREFRRAAFVRNFRLNTRKQRHPADVEKLGHAANSEAIGKPNVSRSKISKFPETGE